MSSVLAARSQMALSLAFHIVFAAVGMAMPLLMVIAEWRHRRSGDPVDLALARAWGKGTAVLFAVGAVSGTVLSFELGLLFPRFMQLAGPIVGLPFSLEGFAFFAEGILLGIYLYGWDRVSPRLHLLAGAGVALAGVASAGFVLIANAWMNAPTGFRLEAGRIVAVDPLAAMATPFALHEVLHMVIAAYLATGFAAAAVHAWRLRAIGVGGASGARAFHRRGLSLALAVAIPSALLQPLSGHHAGTVVARAQPAKLAALEGLERTQARAPISIGPLEIPAGLSLLAFGRVDAVVRGLEELPPGDRPPAIVRPAWLVMVGIGSALPLLGLWALARRLRHGAAWLDSPRLLLAIVLSGPAGFLAIEAGWVVTEVGRQPWVVYGVMRTAESVTPMPDLWVPCALFTLMYLGLSVAAWRVLQHQFRAPHDTEAVAS